MSKRTRELWDELWKVQDERFKAMSQVVKNAIGEGIHVEINVCSEPGKVMAWELWEQLGFPEGSSELTHVTIEDQSKGTLWSRGEGLSIEYSSIVPPSQM